MRITMHSLLWQHLWAGNQDIQPCLLSWHPSFRCKTFSIRQHLKSCPYPRHSVYRDSKSASAHMLLFCLSFSLCQISFSSSLRRSLLLTCLSTNPTRASILAVEFDVVSKLPSYHDRTAISLRRRNSATSAACASCVARAPASVASVSRAARSRRGLAPACPSQR